MYKISNLAYFFFILSEGVENPAKLILPTGEKRYHCQFSGIPSRESQHHYLLENRHHGKREMPLNTFLLIAELENILCWSVLPDLNYEDPS